MIRLFRIFSLLILFTIGGCVTTTPANVLGTDSQLESRQIQTRTYDSLNKQMTMRSVIATLQDLGFTIDQSDFDLGTVTATRLHEYTMRMTVTVVEKGQTGISVRANARINEDSVTDAVTYQDFFVVLDKAIFLTSNNVN